MIVPPCDIAPIIEAPRREDVHTVPPARIAQQRPRPSLAVCCTAYVRFWHKADIARCRRVCLLSERSGHGTSAATYRPAADDPQRSSGRLKSRSAVGPSQWYLPAGSTGDIAIEPARVHHAAWRSGGYVAARGARAAAGADAEGRRPHVTA